MKVKHRDYEINCYRVWRSNTLSYSVCKDGFVCASGDIETKLTVREYINNLKMAIDYYLAHPEDYTYIKK